MKQGNTNQGSIMKLKLIVTAATFPKLSITQIKSAKIDSPRVFMHYNHAEESKLFA